MHHPTRASASQAMSTNIDIAPLSSLLATTIIIRVLPSSHAAFCTYYRSRNTVTCGSVTCCNTAEAGSKELPAGYYYIGNYYLHGTQQTSWFNLYHQRSSGGGFWDYHTLVPELNWAAVVGLASTQEASVKAASLSPTPVTSFD